VKLGRFLSIERVGICRRSRIKNFAMSLDFIGAQRNGFCAKSSTTAIVKDFPSSKASP
jgi:hypothetical protein